MEPVTTSIRPFKDNQQSHKDLKGKPSYYRIHLSSTHKEVHTSVSDATFDVSGVFPVIGRQDLLDGSWEVFVEEWIAFFTSAVPGNTGVYGSYPRMAMKLCLPDLMLSPQDYTSSAHGKTIRDDSVSHVPLDYKFRSQIVTIPPAYEYSVHTTASHTFDGTHANANQIQVVSSGDMIPHTPIHFRGTGTAPGSLTYYVIYYISAIVDATHITISTTHRGPVMVQQTATFTHNIDVIAGTPYDLNVLQGQSNIPADALSHVETRWNNVISRESIGRKIDPHQLMNGKLRIMLRDREHKTIHTGTLANDGSLIDSDRWQVTLLFVHKS